MSVRVDDLPACSACGGKVFPVVLCNTCGAVTILRSAQSLERMARCADCGQVNPWQLICDQCHTQFPAPAGVAGLASPPVDPQADVANPTPRPSRRIKGDIDRHAVMDLLKVLGLDASRAQALIDRGYDAPWKIARAKEDQLARIPEVGPIAARKMVASFHLLNYAPPKRTKESVAQDEYECPLCGCVTSAFSSDCLECGAPFDEEEMEEDIRRAFAQEGSAALVAFYDGRLAKRPDDAELLYARGLLLDSLGRVDEAVASLDLAVSAAPDVKKIKVAQLRLQAKLFQKPEAATKLRSTASALLDDIAWEEEVAQLDRMITEAERECPHCGAAVPAEMALCPSCGLRLSPPAPAPPSKRPEASPTPELDALVDDLLVGELEESLSSEELERTKAAVLDWLIEELEESMAPETRIAPAPMEQEAVKDTPEGEKPAPPPPTPIADSLGFLSQWVRGSRGLVSGVRPKQAPRGTGRVNGVVNGRGRVNGLVNGVGRTNGLVNGMGRVNGLTAPAGRVNGLVTSKGRVNGLVTGTGRVNGVAVGAGLGRPSVRGLRLRLPYPSRRVRYLSITAALLVAITIAAILFVPPSGPSAPITIDGSFGDWSSVPMFDAATVASDANVSIARYASFLDHDSLYLFASMRGGTLGDATGYDGVDFLIDADGNASTGFVFGGIGADSVIEVFGGNHSVAGARLYSFPADSEVNWSRRQPGSSVQAASSAGGLEVKVSTYDLDRFDATRFRALVYADDFLGASSRSLAALSPSEAAILLDVTPLTPVIGSGTTPLFQVHARALGVQQSSIWQVSNFQFNKTAGLSLSLSAESLNLTQGRPEDTITVSVSAPGFFPGDAAVVSLTGASGSVPVFIHASTARAYVTAPSSQVRIDGLFGDWVSRDVPDTDSTPVRNPDLNIVRYGAATSNGTAFFHANVAGTLFGGAIPERLFKSPVYAGNGSSGGGSTILPRRTGENLLFAYLQSNASNPRGFSIGGISADYLVELRGDSGRLTSRSVYFWQNGWVRQAGISVAAAKDDSNIEASLPIADLNRSRIVIQSTDWTSGGDTTIPLTAPSFAPPLVAPMAPFSLAAPLVPLAFGGSTFYLRNSNPGIIPSDCSAGAVKGLSTIIGTTGTTILLDVGVKACFFTDPAASGETILAGLWSASLDLASTGNVLNVTFVVTNQDGSSPILICWDNKTTGALEQVFSCNAGNIAIATNQRIRLRVEYISGLAVALAYDGSLPVNDSSLTVPVPEFGEAATPALAVAVAIFVLTLRRRRRTD